MTAATATTTAEVGSPTAPASAAEVPTASTSMPRELRTAGMVSTTHGTTATA